jgi:hypothetical protein
VHLLVQEVGHVAVPGGDFMNLRVGPITFRTIFYPGADFSYIFCGENFGENSAENFSPKNVKKKWNFPRKKVFKNRFSKKFHGIFRGK